MMEWNTFTGSVVSIVAVTMCCLLIGRVLLPGSRSRYSRRSSILDAAQQPVGELLLHASGRMLICPRILVGDLIEPRKGSGKTPLSDRALLGERVDFVLCDHRTWEPRIAVLLLDSPVADHECAEALLATGSALPPTTRQTTAPPLARLLASAGLAVVCIPTGSALSPAVFQSTLRRAMEVVEAQSRR